MEDVTQILSEKLYQAALEQRSQLPEKCYLHLAVGAIAVELGVTADEATKLGIIRQAVLDHTLADSLN